MANSAIKSTEIVNDDIFSNYILSAKAAIKETEVFEAQIVSFSKSINEKLSKVELGSSSGIKDAQKQIADSEKLLKKFEENQAKKINAISLERKAIEMSRIEEIKLQKAREKSFDDYEKAQTKHALKQEKEAKAQEARIKKEIATAEKLNEPYNKLSRELSETQKRALNLGAALTSLGREGKKDSEEFRKLSKEFENAQREAAQLNSQVVALDRSIGRNQREVGNYENAFEKARRGFGSFQNVIGGLGLSLGVFSLLKNGISIISDFETSLAELSAITGLKGKELESLGESAIVFSKKFGTSASNINEAFKLAGSARPELLKNSQALEYFTEQALILSRASGDDLESSISSLAGTLNAFDEPATRAAKVIDILSNASQLGTQEIPFLNDAFVKFGGIAKSSNVSIAESAALVEELGKKFPEASVAGTGLRSVLLKLSGTRALPKEAQAELERYGVSFQGLEDKSKPFSERLKLLNPLLKDSAALQKIFGQENFLAAQTLISGADNIAVFTKELDKNGTASEQAEIKSQTLTVAGEKLKANFQALFLEFKNSSGSLTSVVNFLANNLPQIIKLIFSLGIAFVALKLKSILGDLKGLREGFNGISSAGEQSLSASQKFGKALKGVGLAVAIDLAINFALALFDVASGAEAAREAQQKLNKAINSGKAFADKTIKNLQDQAEKQLFLLELKKAEGKITEANFILEKQKINENIRFKLDVEKKISKEDVENAEKKVKRDAANLKKIKARFNKTTGDFDRGVYRLFSGTDLSKAEKQLATSRATLAGYRKEVSTYNETLTENAKVSDTLEIQIAENFNTEKENLKSNTKLQKEKNVVVKEAIDLENLLKASRLKMEALQNQNSLKLNQIDIDNEILKQSQQINEESSFNMKVLNESIENEKVLTKIKIEQVFLNDLLNAKNNIDVEIANLQKKIALEQLEIDIKKKRTDIEIDLDEKLSNKTKPKTDDNSVQIESDKIANEIADKADQLEIDKKKKHLETLAQLEQTAINEGFNFLIEKSKQKELLLDREIEGQRKLQDTLQNLAENGNITAQQSIAASIQAQEAATLAKQKEAQKQQQLEAIKRLSAMVVANLNQGDKPVSALTKAIASEGIISGFLSSVKGFAKGTKRRVKDEMGANIDLGSDPDNRLIRVAGDEAILNGNQMNMLAINGLNSTDEIVQNAINSKNGGSNNFSTKALEKRIDALTEIVKNKTENTFSTEFMNGIAQAVIKTSKSNNQKSITKWTR